MVDVLAFVGGLILGSFLNVCIHRLPRGESIVHPGSRCPRCGVRIRFRDNIPLLGYVLLRGRCRRCRQRISWRYPLVELLTAAMMVALVRHFGLTPQLAVNAAFVAAMIVVAFIDLDHRIIPDVISLPGIVVGLAVAAAGLGPPLEASVAGVLLGGGFLYAVAVGYERLAGRMGMGGGDIKLMAMIGAFLGWKGVLTTLLLASSTGALAGGILILLWRANWRTYIPFGPFLAGAAVFALFASNRIIDWYLDRAFCAY